MHDKWRNYLRIEIIEIRKKGEKEKMLEELRRMKQTYRLDLALAFQLMDNFPNLSEGELMEAYHKMVRIKMSCKIPYEEQMNCMRELTWGGFMTKTMNEIKEECQWIKITKRVAI